MTILSVRSFLTSVAGGSDHPCFRPTAVASPCPHSRFLAHCPSTGRLGSSRCLDRSLLRAAVVRGLQLWRPEVTEAMGVHIQARHSRPYRDGAGGRRRRRGEGKAEEGMDVQEGGQPAFVGSVRSACASDASPSTDRGHIQSSQAAVHAPRHLSAHDIFRVRTSALGYADARSVALGDDDALPDGRGRAGAAGLLRRDAGREEGRGMGGDARGHRDEVDGRRRQREAGGAMRRLSLAMHLTGEGHVES
jgi:hypothetical protein